MKLEFDNQVRGFYAEGKYATHKPSPVDVTFISRKTKGIQPESGRVEECLLGEKYTCKFCITREEAGDFGRIREEKLEELLHSPDTPEDYIQWYQKKKELMDAE